MKQIIHEFFFEVLGLKLPKVHEIKSNNDQLEGVLDLLIKIRDKASASKDFVTSDLIRETLFGLNIQIKDTPEGTSYKNN